MCAYETVLRQAKVATIHDVYNVFKVELVKAHIKLAEKTTSLHFTFGESFAAGNSLQISQPVTLTKV